MMEALAEENVFIRSHVTQNDAEIIHSLVSSMSLDDYPVRYPLGFIAGKLKNECTRKFSRIAYVNKIPVGTILSECQLDERDNHIYFSVVCILPKYRNYGLGSQMVYGILSDASLDRQYDFRYIDLEVWILNHQAINLYQKMGFRFNRVLPHHYGPQTGRRKTFDLGYSLERPLPLWGTHGKVTHQALRTYIDKADLNVDIQRYGVDILSNEEYDDSVSDTDIKRKGYVDENNWTICPHYDLNPKVVESAVEGTTENYFLHVIENYARFHSNMLQRLSKKFPKFKDSYVNRLLSDVKGTEKNFMKINIGYLGTKSAIDIKMMLESFSDSPLIANGDTERVETLVEMVQRSENVIMAHIGQDLVGIGWLISHEDLVEADENEEFKDKEPPLIIVQPGTKFLSRIGYARIRERILMKLMEEMQKHKIQSKTIRVYAPTVDCMEMQGLFSTLFKIVGLQRTDLRALKLDGIEFLDVYSFEAVLPWRIKKNTILELAADELIFRMNVWLYWAEEEGYNLDTKGALPRQLSDALLFTTGIKMRSTANPTYPHLYVQYPQSLIDPTLHVPPTRKYESGINSEDYAILFMTLLLIANSPVSKFIIFIVQLIKSFFTPILG